MAAAKTAPASEELSAQQIVLLQNEIREIRAQQQTIINMLAKIMDKPARTRAPAAATGSKTEKFPANAKAWFLKKYVTDEAFRTPYVALLADVHNDKTYVNLVSESDKIKKEATLVYTKMNDRADMSKQAEAVKSEYNVAREKYKKEQGHADTATTAAADDAAEPKTAAKKEKKPAAKPKPKAKGKAPAKKNASLEDIAASDDEEMPEKKDAMSDDSGDDDDADM